MKHGIDIYGNVKKLYGAFCWMPTVTNSATVINICSRLIKHNNNKTKKTIPFQPSKKKVTNVNPPVTFCRTTGTNHYISGFAPKRESKGPLAVEIRWTAGFCCRSPASFVPCLGGGGVAGWLWLMKEWPVAWGNPF